MTSHIGIINIYQFFNQFYGILIKQVLNLAFNINMESKLFLQNHFIKSISTQIFQKNSVKNHDLAKNCQKKYKNFDLFLENIESL
ncbi:hypothetical protein pb186bvf_012298 [Paramecium bursaria]